KSFSVPGCNWPTVVVRSAQRSRGADDGPPDNEISGAAGATPPVAIFAGSSVPVAIFAVSASVLTQDCSALGTSSCDHCACGTRGPFRGKALISIGARMCTVIEAQLANANSLANL